MKAVLSDNHAINPLNTGGYCDTHEGMHCLSVRFSACGPGPPFPGRNIAYNNDSC